MPKTFSTVLGCVLFFIVLIAQDHGSSAHLGVDEGMSQGSVFDIAQDDLGFIWIATADGLNRFDGHEFKIFRNDPADSLSLQHPNIRNIFPGKDALWITTSGRMELYRMDYASGKIRKMKFFATNDGTDEVCPFKEDGDTLWVLASDHGVVKLNAKTGDVIEEFTSPFNMFPVKNQLVYDSSRAMLWFIGRGYEHLCSFSMETKKFENRPFVNESTNENFKLCSIILDADLNLWIGANNALIAYHPDSELFHDYALPGRTVVNEAIVAALVETDDRKVWCGTVPGAAYIFDEQKKTFTRSTEVGTDTNKSNYRTIRLMIDRTKNLWVGTDPDGIYRIDTKRKPFHHTYHSSGNEHELKSNFIRCFLQVGNELYVGTYDAGIQVFNRDNGTSRSVSGFPDRNNIPVPITAMLADSSGRIWVSTESGLGIIEPGSTQLIRPDKINAHENLNGYITGIRLLPDQSLVVTCGDGLFELKKNGSNYEFIPFPVSGIVETAFADRETNLWIGTSNGIFFLEKNAPPSNTRSVLNNVGRVKTFYQDASGTIWAGSNTGLHKIDPSTRKVSKTYSERDGMPNTFVYGILGDEEQNLWVSTNKGITKFSPARETFKSYTVSDGLQSNEFNTGAYYRNDAGEFFFGGVNGYNHFFPGEIRDNPFAPRTAITALKIFDKPFVSDTAIEYRKHIVLDYTENNLLLGYTALEYTDPAKNKFRYRMKGLDSNWVEAGEARFARFVNLDPGEYIFQVKAANNDGVWNNEPMELSITIVPPFWKTGTFFILVIAAGLILAFVSVRFYLRRQLRIQTREMTLKQNVRMNAIFETEEKERKRIAEELHDGLGQLLSTARLNVAGFEDSIETKDRTRLKNSLDLLDEACAEVRAISHNMMPGALIRLGLVDAVNELINKISDTEKIKAEFDTNLEERFPETMEVALYRIVQEVLNNVVRHAQAKTVQVKMRRTDDMLEVDIVDDGRSFDVTQIAKSQGLGWKNIYSRVEILNGTIRVESEEAKGTRIFIAIPLN